MKRPWLMVFLLLAGIGLCYGTYLAVRASRDLVTLDVRDMEVSKVIGKIEWQTWESIYVQNGIKGKVTLKVVDVPLSTVLQMVSDQAGARWTAVYPLYSSRRSLINFKSAMLAGPDPVPAGWSNLVARSWFGFGQMMGGSQEPGPVTLQVRNKELGVATTALARFAPARIIPENGTGGSVTLNLSQSPMTEAVRQIALQTGRKWKEFYLLELRGFGPGGPGGFAGRRGEGGGAGPREELSETARAERVEAMEKQFQAQLETMTPEERTRAQEMRQQAEAMRNMTPEQRRSQMSSMMSSPEMQARMRQRMVAFTRDSTPEQRVERQRRFEEMRKRFESRQ